MNPTQVRDGLTRSPCTSPLSSTCALIFKFVPHRRTLLSDSTQQLKALSKKLGSCIEKARPYYEALEVSQRAQKECQSAATHYQRASGIHAAAKETIALAEQRFLTNSKHWEFDNAWQEMLNHATMKVRAA